MFGLNYNITDVDVAVRYTAKRMKKGYVTSPKAVAKFLFPELKSNSRISLVQPADRDGRPQNDIIVSVGKFVDDCMDDLVKLEKLDKVSNSEYILAL